MSKSIGIPKDVVAAHVQFQIMSYLQGSNIPYEVAEDALLMTLFEVMLQARGGDVPHTLAVLEHFVSGLIADEIAGEPGPQH